MINILKHKVRFNFTAYLYLFLLICISLVCSLTTRALAQEKDFPWEIFIPAITANHSKSSVTKLWTIRYGGLFYESSAQSIQQTSDDGYIIAGETSFGAGNYPDIWVLKLNTDGSINWQKSYGGDFDDSAHSIQQTADNGYIVAGFGLGSSCWVLKLNADGSSAWQKKCSRMSSD